LVKFTKKECPKKSGYLNSSRPKARQMRAAKRWMPSNAAPSSRTVPELEVGEAPTIAGQWRDQKAQMSRK